MKSLRGKFRYVIIPGRAYLDGLSKPLSPVVALVDVENACVLAQLRATNYEEARRISMHWHSWLLGDNV